jgi:octaprenyl-diphosphate synthase
VAPGATPELAKRATPSAPEVLASLLDADMRAVDQLIHARLSSQTALIPELAAYLIDAGGKRVRPMITLGAATVLGACPPAAHKLAAAVEFIHTATLLHDDVVDESALRRGKKSAHRVWGASASILVGDFLFARAFNLMVECEDLRVLDSLARASSVIAEGEVMQLANAGRSDISIDNYMRVIRAKTAALFAAAARVGAMAAGGDQRQIEALETYGMDLGVAFQLADDALDYGGLSAAMGKNAGDDFHEGKVTLPVILARETGDAQERAFWDRVMGDGVREPADFEHAVAILRRRNAITRTLDFARVHAKNAASALESLPQSPMRDALSNLAHFVVDRSH